MIEVMMRNDAETNRLVRNDFLCFRDYGFSSVLILRTRFEEEDVIGKLDRKRVVCAIDPEDAVGQLFRCRSRSGLLSGRRGCSAAALRRRQELLQVRRIRVRTKNVGCEGRPATALLDDLRGKH